MLDFQVGELRNVGNTYQQRLQRLGIKKVKDLFFHFPYRYLDYSQITPIAEIREEKSLSFFDEKERVIQKQKDTHCAVGIVKNIHTIRSKYKKIQVTEALIEDISGQGEIKAVWFNQVYLSQSIKRGTKIALVGKISFPQRSFISPDYEIITNNEKEMIHTCRIVPIYPVTYGLSSKWYRYLLKPILDKYANQLVEYIPEETREKYKLMAIGDAIKEIHFPTSIDLAEKARYRFSFEELFLIQLSVLKEKQKIQSQKTFKIEFNLEKTKKLIDSLPFQLTKDQKVVSWEILKDLDKNYPMNRLLQGDVGSGKTVVAVIGALNVINNGYQVALMAPTEILALQHFENISKLLKGFKIRVGLLTSKNSKVFIQDKIIDLKKDELFEEVKNQGIDFLIGTHSLISSPSKTLKLSKVSPSEIGLLRSPSHPSEIGSLCLPSRRAGGVNKLEFKKLALIILDEQHRFGVDQRASLSKLSKEKIVPHSLSMTATPIPRTLALTIYGDLNFSIIREMPKDRKIVITKNIPNDKRNDAYNFIREKVQKGEQVFVICPRIEKESTETSFTTYKKWDDVKTVVKEHEKLSKKIFPDLRISMLHGKIKSKEKEKILKDFRDKKSDILVSTSVIEVGIDIPNATIMMIEGAEHFGLAQLHQLRGRVGRSDKQSYCLLFTENQDISPRLRAMEKIHNGFDLAEKDLKIRGPGDFIGSRQWGVPDITMSALTDLNLIQKAKDSALEILKKSPNLSNFPELKNRLDLFQQKIHLE